VDFIATGSKELDRCFSRAVLRVRILLERRKLSQAEINLGQLGWQQAEFPPEVEEQIRAVSAMELEQADLSNRGAEIRWNIKELEAQLTQTRIQNAATLGEMEAALEPLQEALRQIDTSPEALAKQESIRRFEKAMEEIEGRRAELRVQMEALVAASHQTLQIKEQILELGDRRSALENERDDLDRSRMKLVTELRAGGDHTVAAQREIEEQEFKIRQAREEAAAVERELALRIDALRSEEKSAAAHVDRLDRKKHPAFLTIGRCLADFDIAPMNQPEALTLVQNERLELAFLQRKVQASLAESATVSRGTMFAFFAFLAILLSLLLIAGIWLGHTVAAPKKAASSLDWGHAKLQENAKGTASLCKNGGARTA
jgi:chromosome segregation ATPase